jgi:hypothetical protein
MKKLLVRCDFYDSVVQTFISGLQISQQIKDEII